MYRCTYRAYLNLLVILSLVMPTQFISPAQAAHAGIESPSALATVQPVSLTDTGFSPQVAPILSGDTVTWTNNTSKTQVIKSGVHQDQAHYQVYLPIVLKTNQPHALVGLDQASDKLNAGVSRSAVGQESFSFTLAPGDSQSHLFSAAGITPYYSETTASLTGQVVVTDSPLPDDPAKSAPVLSPAAAADISSITRFLYTGSNPVQTGVAAGTIKDDEVSVLRGRVIDPSGNPLPGVKITVMGHAELGQTYSRLDGNYDFALNGGGTFTLVY